MQTRAKLRFLRQSPRKVRLVCDILRGLDVTKAEHKLEFLNKKASESILKLLKSAVANALNNDKLKKDNLFIKEVRVDQGPTLKRWRARAHGRASAIRKKSSHIIIVLEEKVPSKKMKKQEKPAELETQVVKSLEEAKQIEKQEEDKKMKVENELKNDTGEGGKEELFGISRANKNKHKQRLDQDQQKKEGKGWRGRMFRRKTD